MIRIRPPIHKLGAVAAIFAIVLSACSPSESNVAIGNRTGVLHYGIGSEVQTLDPHVLSDTGAWQLSGALFEGLVRLDPQTLEPEPGVAKSWQLSNDGLTLIFKLNPDAKWSNGDAVTAEDFVWSWRRSLHPAMGNILADFLYPIKNAEPYARGLIDDPEQLGVQALDKLTLKVQLENPTPHIFQLLSTPTAYPVHRATIEAHGAATARPTGSIVPQGITGYTAQHHVDFNPAQARRLLAEAGYAQGERWPGLELVYNTDENHRRIAVAVQQMWSEHLNIEVTLANQEWKVYLDTVDNKQFRLARMGWKGSYLDPGTFLNRFTTHGATNRTGYSDMRYDEIIEKLAPAAPSRKERYALMAEAESLFMQQYAIIHIYSYTGKHLVQPSVGGYYPNVLENRNFKRLTLDASMGEWQWQSNE